LGGPGKGRLHQKGTGHAPFKRHSCGYQLVHLHLCRNHGPFTSSKPGLLHQSTCQCFIGDCVSKGETAALASFGGVLTVNYGMLPWIALALAFSFGFYGLLRKTVLIESVNGLFVETSLLFPFAVVYLLYRAVKGVGAFGVIDWHTTTLLLLAGLVTSLPLVWFTSAARRLQYTTIGIVQYLEPSLQFLLAVLYYREPFTRVYLLTFGCIWAGLAIFIADSLSLQRRNPIRP